MQKTTSAPKFLTRAIAASQLSLSTRTLDRMIRAGKIRAVKVSDRRLGVPASEIERIAAGLPVAA